MNTPIDQAAKAEKIAMERLALLKQLAMLDYEKAERSFSHFFKSAWSVLEPTTPRLDNWHQEAIAEYLEAVYLGKIKRLIINMPPRYSKSLLVTVMFPAWCWLKNPSMKFINASYAEDLAVKHAVDRRILMQSQWYQARWGKRFAFSAEQNQKAEYINDKRGHCVAAGMLGAVTGKGGDVVIIDDPHNPKRAESDAERKSAIEAFDSTFTTRLDDKKNGRIIVVMQRLHYNDLTGHLLKKKDQGEHWTHLNLPAEAPKRMLITLPITKRKVLRNEGDILHPDREGPKELAAMKVSLSSYNYAGQYQQSPSPRDGGIFKTHYWRYYTVMPEKFDEVIQSWDLSFKDKNSSDPVAGLVLGRLGADIYILDCVSGRLSYSKCKEAIAALSKRWPQAYRKLIENKANGPAIQDDLKSKIFGIILEEPQGGKIERAAFCEPFLEAGNIHLPHEHIAQTWVKLLIAECTAFPRGEHDDMVDALTQGIKALVKMALERVTALGTI